MIITSGEKITMSVNKVILVGRLGKDPELRYTQSQQPVATLVVATSERRKGQDGQWSEATEWHRVITFGKTAENCSQYLQKGRELYVEGALRTNKWQDKTGQDRYMTEIIANTVQFLGGKGAGSSDNLSSGVERTYSGEDTGGAFSPAVPPAATPFEDDDIPF
jgi:single-strand DNA-binding protein